jgi:DNA-binding NarL/FixJ family response regulator
MNIRVLIADDQAMVREGFTVLLNAQPGIEVVGAAVDGEDAVRKTAALAPDVVLMDVRMPVVNGLEATRRILDTHDTVAGDDRAAGLPAASGSADAPAGDPPVGDAPAGGGRTDGERPRPRVLVLTTFDLDDYVYEALRAGASGFLLKDASAAKLAEAVRVVAAGEALLSPGVTRRLIAEFARLGPVTGLHRGRIANLTERETEVLALIARGLSNTEIAGQLFVAEQTVKTHVGRILAKLALRDRVQAVVYAYETGLIRPGRSS